MKPFRGTNSTGTLQESLAWQVTPMGPDVVRTKSWTVKLMLAVWESDPLAVVTTTVNWPDDDELQDIATLAEPAKLTVV